MQNTIPRTGKIASALLHAVCTCEFIPCSQSNEGCVTRFISRANNALELRFFSKLWVGGDDVDGLGAIMRGSLRYCISSIPLGERASCSSTDFPSRSTWKLPKRLICTCPIALSPPFIPCIIPHLRPLLQVYFPLFFDEFSFFPQKVTSAEHSLFYGFFMPRVTFLANHASLPC